MVLVDGDVKQVLAEQDSMPGRVAQTVAGHDGAARRAVQDQQTRIGRREFRSRADQRVAARRAEASIEFDGDARALEVILLHIGEKVGREYPLALHRHGVALD